MRYSAGFRSFRRNGIGGLRPTVLGLCLLLTAVLSGCLVAGEQQAQRPLVARNTAPVAAAPTVAPRSEPATSPAPSPGSASPTLSSRTPDAVSTSIPPATRPPTAAAASENVYTVQPGDTLFGLSRQTGVPAADIARANGLPADAQLRIGQQLRIPTTGATAAPAAPASASGIRVTSPASGTTVRGPIVVQGSASTFEGLVTVEVLDANGAQLARGTTTAAMPQPGQYGAFRAEIAVPPSAADRRVTLRLYWNNPRDGSPMDEMRIPLTVASAT